MNNKIFAKVSHYVFDKIISGADNKALAMFLLMKFRAGSDLKIYADAKMLCQLLNISGRTENIESVTSILKFMEQEGWICIDKNNKKFFCISLNRNVFFPVDNYAIIYQNEFDLFSEDVSRDKLLAVLYCIKRYQHKQSSLSFVSMDKIMNTSGVSKPTLCNCLNKLQCVFKTYKYRLTFSDGSFKDIKCYKSIYEHDVSESDVRQIILDYYANFKFTLTPQND